jgi:hypothetical protein
MSATRQPHEAIWLGTVLGGHNDHSKYYGSVQLVLVQVSPMTFGHKNLNKLRHFLNDIATEVPLANLASHPRL